MAYIPGFKWDLFISYPMEAESWSRRFEADLRAAEPLAAATDLAIYFPRRDWQRDEISDDVLEAVRNSALFVAVLTKNSFVEGETRFLQREMEAFRQSGPLQRRFCPIALHPDVGSQLSEAMPFGDSDA